MESSSSVLAVSLEHHRRIGSVPAYCKFSGLPTKVQKSHQLNAFTSSTSRYNLPVLEHGSVIESQTQKIFSYLRNKNLGVDNNLNSKQKADISAFSCLIQEKLHPAYIHQWWIDRQTYEDVTRPTFAKATPFPFNFFVPGQLHKEAKTQVYGPRVNDVINETDVESMIYKEAKECLNHLSYRLGENDFFFGDQPSSLDALVFGYVAPLLKASLPNSQLANHVKGCQNLSGLCTRIMMRYFPMSPEDVEEKRKREEEMKEKIQTDALEFPNKRRNMILAVIFAASALIGFAFVSGILNIVKNDNYQSDDFGAPVEEEENGGGEEDQ